MAKRLIAFLLVLMLAITALSFALADDWSGVYGPYCGTNEWGPCPSSGGCCLMFIREKHFRWEG